MPYFIERELPIGADFLEVKTRIEDRLVDFEVTVELDNKHVEVTIHTDNWSSEQREGRKLVKDVLEEIGCEYFYNMKKVNKKYGGSAGWDDFEEHHPRLSNGKLDYRWNHKCVNFDKAIQQISAENQPEGRNKLDLSKGHLATGIKVFQFDTGSSNHSAVASYPGYMKDDPRSRGFIPGEQGNKDSLKSYDVGVASVQKPGHGTATAYTMIGQPDDITQENWSEPTVMHEDYPTFKLENYGKGLFPYVDFFPNKLSKTVTLGGPVARAILASRNVGIPDALIPAIDHAIDCEADVITMSMGGNFKNDGVAESLKRVYNAGIIMVCAAGNGKFADMAFDVVTPADYTETIAVAALMPVDGGRGDFDYKIQPWDESCDGLMVDVSAPGKYIYTTAKLNPNFINEIGLRASSNNGDLFKWGGATSQATVHVASAAALWKFYYRQLLQDEFYSVAKNRIVEAFRFALYSSRRTPEYWSDRDNRDYKGVLDVKGVINPDYAPDSTICRDYILLVEQEEYSDINRFKVYQENFEQVVTA